MRQQEGKEIYEIGGGGGADMEQFCERHLPKLLHQTFGENDHVSVVDYGSGEKQVSPEAEHDGYDVS